MVNRCVASALLSLRTRHNNVWLTGVATLACVLGVAINSASAAKPPKPLFIMNADGTELRQLVQLQDHQCMGAPTWSRDGKHILFDAWRRSEGFLKAHIYIVNADGTWPKDLGPGAMPNVNFTGLDSIASHYYANRQGVWLGVANGVLVEESGGSPRWHPHESKLAYVKWSGGIAMRDVNGVVLGEEEMIVPAEHHPYVGFAWSPDAKAIAFYSNRKGGDQSELLIMNIADKKNEVQVKATGKIGWMVSWSPDGTKVAFDNYSAETKTQQVYVVDPTSDAPAYRLPGQDPSKHNGDPAWSPDGKKIVFTSKVAAKRTAEAEPAAEAPAASATTP